MRASYDGVEGIWLLTMPMTSEQAVIGGRETYGEPKKIAQIDFARNGERVSAPSSRAWGSRISKRAARCTRRSARASSRSTPTA